MHEYSALRQHDKVLGMDGIDWEAVIADTVPEKFRDMNIRAYRAGYGAV